ncbi:ABC transporter permease subunit [Alphaproteobacteria bacterium HT1-32]|nr:ABC transporter permease subunit [Alphaproteobacteria bacterium HT1-32]
MTSGLRMLAITVLLLLGWQLVVWLTGVPPYLLPGPMAVAVTLVDDFGYILHHAGVTGLEILLGLLLGTLLGSVSALTLASFRSARRWLLPLLVISQALPVFALAPVLTLWLGYGLFSKVAMATLIIYFPVTAAFYDGLRATEPGWVDFARTVGATPRSVLRHIRIPAALPAFGSGLRVAAAVAPIGAVVGEWVGSSAGLGFLMLHANGRMQIDLMFAALAVLAVIGLVVYFATDLLLRRLTRWQTETLFTDMKGSSS